MQENVNWLLAASIILLWPSSNGVQFITKNSKNGLRCFMDNILLRNGQSDKRLPPASSRENSITMDLQSSSTMTSLSHRHGIVTSPDKLVSQVVELDKTGRISQTFISPALSEKDTSRIVSLDRYSEATVSRSLFERDDANINSSFRRWSNSEAGKRAHKKYIKLGRSYSRNNRKFRLALQNGYRRNVLHSRKSNATNAGFLSASCFHDRTLEQYKARNTSSTKSNIKHTDRIFRRRRFSNVLNSSPTLRRLRRRMVQPTGSFRSTKLPSIFLKDAVDANATHTNQVYSTTEITHPITQKPVDNFEPWITKSQFITAASSSLVLVMCLGVIIFYIRRRRRLRSEDPERQKLIPFRVSVGVYYNQTGPCF